MFNAETHTFEFTTSEYSSLNELRTELVSLVHDKKNVFRGQKNGSWLVRSSLARNYSSKFRRSDDTSDVFLYVYYSNALRKMHACDLFSYDEKTDYHNYLREYYRDFHPTFRKELRKLSGYKLTDTTVDISSKQVRDLENEQRKHELKINNILLRLQHYNIPTHLIDITHSPFVALYFALFADKDEPKVDASKDTWPTILVFENHSLDFDGINFFQNELVDPRAYRQQGGYIDTMSYFSLPKAYRSIPINPEWIPDLFIELKSMNVTGASLFDTPEMTAVDYFWDCRFSIDEHVEKEKQYRNDFFRKHN